MDHLERPRPAPHDRLTAVHDEATDLREIDAAIGLVGRGLAIRVRLVGLGDVGSVLGVALARAQAARVTFRADRIGTSTDLTIGPRR